MEVVFKVDFEFYYMSGEAKNNIPHNNKELEIETIVIKLKPETFHKYQILLNDYRCFNKFYLKQLENDINNLINDEYEARKPI